MKIRTLIVDDEPLARLNLSSLLALAPDFELAGECADAASAIGALAALRPDVLFLDIEMPGMNGFGVLDASAMAPPPAIVFVTAHDEFAVRAFEVQALDYLQKPFRRERFRATLDRVRQRLRADAAGPPATVAADRVALRCGQRWRFVAHDEIDFIRAAANYATLHVGDQCHDVRETMTELEARLPRGRFVRIHRSYIVPLARLESLYPVGGGEYLVMLRGGRELPVGASYLGAIRGALAAARIDCLGGSSP